MPRGLSGSVAATADSVIGASGKPVRIYNATWLSTGSAGTLVLRNGSDATGTVWVQQEGTASQTKTVNWEGGLLFTSGCFFDKDASVTLAVFEAFTEI